MKKKMDFSLVLGESATKTRPSNNKVTAAPSVGTVTEGKKGTAKKMGGKRVF